MAYEFKLPDIGEGVVEGEIVRWLVKEGDVLGQDQPMVEIMTDKATVEIPAPRAGRVLARMYAEGQVCPVGKVLIAIEEDARTPAPEVDAHAARRALAPDTVAPQVAPPPYRPAATARPAGARPETAAPPRLAGAGPEAVLATPATRKLARDLELDITTVAGTGPGGKITSEDVRAASTGQPAPLPGGRRAADATARVPARAPRGPDVRVPLRGVRRKIAEHMIRSKREAAHFTYVEEVDCTQLVGLRGRANTRLAADGLEPPLKLSYLPFVVKATVDALMRFPQLNATLDEKAGEIVQRREYHIGVAAQTADGLVVPVLRDADRRSIVDLAREIDRLSALTKSGKVAREELTGSTFTITSLGVLGGVLATPIINYPEVEVAILGVHKISKRPVVFEDKIVVRDMMNLSISVDHRLVDGFDAARFVAEIKESLESPGLLFLESV